MSNHFLGVGEGVGVVMRVEGDETIGVLRSFKLSDRESRLIFQLREGVYNIPGRVVQEIPIERCYINEAWLRVTLLDAEYDQAPLRTHFPE